MEYPTGPELHHPETANLTGLSEIARIISQEDFPINGNH
jgi:hypothetical protein